MGTVALIGAIAGAALWASGGVRPGRVGDLGRWLTLTFGVTAIALLTHDLITIDEASRYVARFSSDRTPLPYRLAGLWGGMEGSMLMWSVVVAGCVAVARQRTPVFSRTLDIVGGALTATFLAVTLLWASPFERLAVPTGRGDGLPAVLQHPAMLIHPPVLYVGLAWSMIPMPIAIAALARRSLDADWRSATVLWARAAWLVLGIGMVLGSNWAYAELGWGGFWAWDPVENAALVPWLLLTALLHTARSRHEGAQWPTAALAVAAGVTTIVGVYATRSGGTGSIHAFASSPTIGRALIVLALVVAAGGGWALAHVTPIRWPVRGADAVLVVQAVALTLVALVVAAGTFGPLVVELFGGRPGTVRAEAYATVLAPAALVVLIGAAVGPLVAGGRWRQVRYRLIAGAVVGATLTTTAVAFLDAGRSTAGAIVLGAGLVSATVAITTGLDRRSARRTGVAVAHAGVALLLTGAAGTALGPDTSVVVPVGDTAIAPEATVTLHDLVPGSRERYEFVRADVTVAGSGHRFRPELRAYDDQPLPTAEAAFEHRWFGDTIVVMSVLEDDLSAARITVRERPLVSLVWWGAATTATGAVVAWFATRARAGSAARRAGARTGSGGARSRSATPAPRTTAASAADATSSSR